jgi:ferredoxin
MAKACPGKTFGLLVRGCDERALDAVMRESRLAVLDRDHVVKVGFSCPHELAEKHECYKPWPDALTVGEKTEGAAPPEQTELDLPAELERWRPIMDRCLKCFGCRNVCPVCDCRECTMEIEALVPQRELPPDNSFLFTRAVHMVDRCSYCGLCEEACPASIPLKELYRTVAKAMGMGLTLPGAPLLVRPVDLFRRPKAI